MSEDREFVRGEWDGNKYYLPRAELVRTRPALSWAWWLVPAAFYACGIASLIIGRFL